MPPAPVVSVIVPCRNAAEYLPAAAASLRAAADRFSRPMEIICIDDGSSDGTADVLEAIAHDDGRFRVLRRPPRGVSAARNAGLDVASGEYVMFMDADDTVLPDWISAGVGAMEASGADYCHMAHLHRDPGEVDFWTWRNRGEYACSSRDDVRRELIARMIGYSMDDIRRWFSGGGLFDTRELAGVWAGVYRRSEIERRRLRFDESLCLFEDAAFNCAYLLDVAHTTAVDEPLYVYDTRETGFMLRYGRSAEAFRNKAKWLEVRKSLDRASGGVLEPLFAGSCVFAVLEMLADRGRSGIPRDERVAAVRAYCADPVTRRALASCPLSWRKPVFSLAVRLLSRGRLSVLLAASDALAVAGRVFAGSQRHGRHRRG